MVSSNARRIKTPPFSFNNIPCCYKKTNTATNNYAIIFSEVNKLKLQTFIENYAFGDYEKSLRNSGWVWYWVPKRIAIKRTKRYGKLLSALTHTDCELSFINKLASSNKTFDIIRLNDVHILVSAPWRYEKYVVIRNKTELYATNKSKQLVNYLNQEETLWS